MLAWFTTSTTLHLCHLSFAGGLLGAFLPAISSWCYALMVSVPRAAPDDCWPWGYHLMTLFPEAVLNCCCPWGCSQNSGWYSTKEDQAVKPQNYKIENRGKLWVGRGLSSGRTMYLCWLETDPFVCCSILFNSKAATVWLINYIWSLYYRGHLKWF